MAIDQHIFLAADCIVTTPERQVLLIRRKNPPFQGQWAFPGGFVEDDEELVQAAVRELKEETGLEVSIEAAQLVRTIGTLGRDPRFRTVSVVYQMEVTENSEVKGGDDASEAKWFSWDELPELAFDHGSILREVLGL